MLLKYADANANSNAMHETTQNNVLHALVKQAYVPIGHSETLRSLPAHACTYPNLFNVHAADFVRGWEVQYGCIHEKARLRARGGSFELWASGTAVGVEKESERQMQMQVFVIWACLVDWGFAIYQTKEGAW